MSIYNSIARNDLDFILTDTSPVEISQLYTLRYFYDFLMDRQNYNVIKKFLNYITCEKDNNKRFIESRFNSLPLEFKILKRDRTFRVMSLPNPLGALMSFCYIKTFEKDILSFIEQNNIFSLRYPTRNTRLFFVRSMNKIIEYYPKAKKGIGKDYIDFSSFENSGDFFKIQKYTTIVSFTNSRLFTKLSFKFSKLLKMDYKNCFRSIYSHAYSWFQFNSRGEAKSANCNSTFLSSTDVIVQRINGGVTNGLIVGPEFSRLLAEIFLESIDKKVKYELDENNLVFNKDYFVGRFVDDVFIFANSDIVLNKIKTVYEKISQEYFLEFNSGKTSIMDLPILINWFKDTNFFAKEIDILLSNDEGDFIFNGKVSRFKIKINIINNLIAESQLSDRETIVAYLLSTILRKLTLKNKNKKIFPDDITSKKIAEFCNFILTIYSYSISFNNTQKVITIFQYFKEDLKNNNKIKFNKILSLLFTDFDFIFDANINEIVNLFIMFYDFKVELDVSIYNKISSNVYNSDDPIIIGTWLYYRRNSESVKNKVSEILNNKINFLKNKKSKDCLLYREFWYVLIFFNCKFISTEIITSINDYIKNISLYIQDLINNKENGTKNKEKCTDKQSKPNNNNDLSSNILLTKIFDLLFRYFTECNDGFFNWNVKGEKDLTKYIAYRTYNRTVFRKSGAIDDGSLISY